MGRIVLTHSPAAARVHTGSSSSAGALFVTFSVQNAANCSKNKIASPITANAPTCESLRIFCRTASSRRDKIASQQSI